MFSVSIFLQNIGTKINVSIWNFHIFWSVHPWRKQVDHVMQLFADQIVVYRTVQIFVSSVYRQTFMFDYEEFNREIKVSFVSK